MSQLLLLRHARAAWAEPGMRDFDRKLDDSGIAEAQFMGAAMARAGLFPDVVFCSTARRARETWTNVAAQLARPQDDATFHDTLYSGDAAVYLDLARAEGRASSLLIVGHNPMIEDLAMALSVARDSEARQRLSAGFPTAGLAVIGFRSTLATLQPDAGLLEHFLTP